MASINAVEIEEKITQLAVEYGKAELHHKLCQARHKRHKEERVHAAGDELVIARANYQEAMQDEAIARGRSEQLRTKLFSMQFELVSLCMSNPDEEFRIVAEMRAAY